MGVSVDSEDMAGLKKMGYEPDIEVFFNIRFALAKFFLFQGAMPHPVGRNTLNIYNLLRCPSFTNRF